MVLAFIGVIVFAAVSYFIFLYQESGENLVQIVELPPAEKVEVGRYLVLTNALHQRSLDIAKTLMDHVRRYEEEEMGWEEFSSLISTSNKRLTYFYLVSLQNDVPDRVSALDMPLNYDLYMFRRASEELLKYLSDRSTLRLRSGVLLLEKALSRENISGGLIATAIVRYGIDPSVVVIENEIWEREHTFLAQTSPLVIFKDLNSYQRSEYSTFLRHVNEAFMLISWEIQNAYNAKISFENGTISAGQLDSSLEKFGSIIQRAYDEFHVMDTPLGLEALQRDTGRAMVLYRDAALEMQRFRKTQDLVHFDNALAIIQQADVQAGRIGEFIHVVRAQYGF